MSQKFEIDQLEERIAPSALAFGGTSASVSGSDTITVGLPIIGNISVGVSVNDSVSVSGLNVGLPSLPSLPLGL